MAADDPVLDALDEEPELLLPELEALEEPELLLDADDPVLVLDAEDAALGRVGLETASVDPEVLDPGVVVGVCELEPGVVSELEADEDA